MSQKIYKLAFKAWFFWIWTLRWQCLVLTGDVLQNGDFEAPPAKISLNNTNQRIVLKASNTVPGWVFGGVVEYVTGGGDISLPNNGHGIQLGHQGWITQSFISIPQSLYLLTFTFTPAGEDCWWTPSYLTISGPPNSKAAFYLEQRYGDHSWETHAWAFTATARKSNLTFASQAQNYANLSCGPLLDAVYLKQQGDLQSVEGNILLNGDFEEGPYIYPKSSGGVLMHPQAGVDGHASSLPGWKIMDTVKYVGFEGNGAVEIVSGPTGGIQQTVALSVGLNYVLKFQAGDANDSCVSGLAVGVQVGSTLRNFSYMSYGRGDYLGFSMEFTAFAQMMNISFISLYRAQTKELEFCGPVIDNVILVPSHAHATLVSNHVIVFVTGVIAMASDLLLFSLL